MIEENQLKIKFCKGKEGITSHSGLIIVGKAFQRVVKRRWIEGLFPLKGSNRAYESTEYIEPMVVMLCGGIGTSFQYLMSLPSK